MTTNHTLAERGEREITQEDLEVIPQDIMLSIPAYMHRSIFKAVAQVRIAARNAALEEARQAARATAATLDCKDLTPWGAGFVAACGELECALTGISSTEGAKA